MAWIFPSVPLTPKPPGTRMPLRIEGKHLRETTNLMSRLCYWQKKKVPQHSLSTAEFLPCLVVFHWLFLQSARLQIRWVYILRRRDILTLGGRSEELKIYIHKDLFMYYLRASAWATLLFLFLCPSSCRWHAACDSHWMINIVDGGLLSWPTLPLIFQYCAKRESGVWAFSHSLKSSSTLNLVCTDLCGFEVQVCCTC